MLPAVLIIVAAALCLSAQPVDLNGWLNAIESVDRSVLEPNARPPKGLVAELRNRIPNMKDAARVVAAQVLENLDTAAGASVLLLMLHDPSLSVASAASRALRNARNLPAGEEILRAIPTVESATLRAHLFLAAGKTKIPLPLFRQALAAEVDPEAKQAALAAAIRLGGDIERAKLAALVRDAKMPDVVQLMDLLVYTGDKRMGAALLPMFDSQEPIMRISPGPNSRMARRSDFAVWTAHQLGLIPNLRLTAIRNFDASVIAAARAACAKEK